MLQDYIKKLAFVLIGIGLVFFVLNLSKNGSRISVSAERFLSSFFSDNQSATASNTSTLDTKLANTNHSDPNNPQNGPIQYEEGKHYQKLSAKITSKKEIQDFIAEDKDKLQVVEFFSYACFWCQRLHPIINEWVSKKPENVVFYRFPVVFHTGWDKLAKAYYMVEQLGQSETLDKDLFEAVQEKHLNLSDEKELKEFFIKHNVSEEKFNALYNSFAVTRAFDRGNEISNAYQIAISPVLILNAPSGSYLISAAMVGTEQGVIDVLNYLIAKEKQ